MQSNIPITSIVVWQIALGTVTNVEEAVKWLSYTYLHVRMRLNPMAYGVVYKNMEEDPSLEGYRKKLIVDAGKQLDKVNINNDKDDSIDIDSFTRALKIFKSILFQ